MLSKDNMSVLINVIGAVESGGQIYGNRRYSAYAGPYTNSPTEYTVTLGWAQNYGYEAKRLVKMIYDKDPSAFHKLDGAGIVSMLSVDWVAIRWNPNSSQKAALIRIIDSPIGHDCQDNLFASMMETFVSDCERLYTKNVKAIMMYCEIRHLGGSGPVDRIFKRCNGNYGLDNIMNSLRADQNDTSNSNQVGDAIYWSRHVKCREFIDKYANSASTSTQTPTSSSQNSTSKPSSSSNTGSNLSKPKASECKAAVKKYQTFVNENYSNLATIATGRLLDVDGSYGGLTRGASITIWKYMLNKYYGKNFLIGNLNFFSNCKEAAKLIDNAAVSKHITLAKVLQGALAGRGFYGGDVDGSIGPLSNAAIINIRKSFGLSADNKIDSTLWYKLFN